MNIKRFQEHFCSIAQFGIQKNGGVTRLALSKEDMDARNYLIEIMRCARLQVKIDPVGNIRGVRLGSEPNLPPVMIGSHLDTVPDGGHYDGVIGVLAALEAVETLNDMDVETKRSIEIVNFTAEESSRFGMATIGSKAITGKLKISELEQLNDSNGEKLIEVLNKAGQHITDLPNSIISSTSLHAYLELHIEQGPVLETISRDIGIVTDIAAPTRYKLQITGRSDHSGNTPMTMRYDALAGAAEIILAVEQRCKANQNTVGTVGDLVVKNGAMNVIPGQVNLTIDIRDTNMMDKQRVIEELEQTIISVGETRQLQITTARLCNDQPVKLSDAIAKLIAQQATNLQLSYKFMPSGAGHDAMHFADLAPTGLIFIPSIDGLSHNPGEKSLMSDITNGIEVLTKTIIELTS